MTQTLSPGVPAQPPPPPPQATPSATAPATQPQRTSRQATARGTGIGLILLGAFLLGFAGYLFGVSGIQESRAQSTSYATLRAELGQATAPIRATTPGSPVAILNIPAIGIKNMIVVEGTSPENLELGPGHVRSTPLPGEAGVSEIFGRRATFGAPFGRLGDLKRGDKVIVITSQGRASYAIAARGDSQHLVEDPHPNRLILFTACSAVIPTSYCYLDAELTTAAQPDPGGRPAISPAELPLNGDFSVLVVTMVWAMALLLVSVAGTVAAAQWSPRLAYLATAPLLLAVLWNLYQSLAALLPNVY